VIDTATKTVVGTLYTGDAPTGIALDSTGSTLYVTHAVAGGYVSITAL
jgi:DNA-binding beta-propeller fold protein YncE